MTRPLSRLLKNNRGATAVEYGFIIALIFLAIAAAVGQVASTTTEMWYDVSNKVTTAS